MSESDLQTEYFLKIFEKIGTPLLSVLDGTDSEKAEELSTLLAKTAEMSEALSPAMDIKDDQENADSFRLGLTALSAPLIASYFKREGKAPDENGIAEIVEKTKSVMRFSEKYKTSVPHIQGLEVLGSAFQSIDPKQIELMYLQAMLPVMSAVHDFSFDRDPIIFVQDIGDKLKARAKKAAAKIIGDQQKEESEQSYIEFTVLKALATLYVDCHRKEGGKPDGEPSDTAIWTMLDTKIEMIYALLGLSEKPVAEVPSQEAPSQKESASVEEPQEPEEPEAEKEPVKEEDSEEDSEEDTEEEQEESEAQTGESPMSFFASSDDDGEKKSAAESKVDKQGAQKEKSDANAESAKDSAKDENPMSFFSAGDEEGDEKDDKKDGKKE